MSGRAVLVTGAARGIGAAIAAAFAANGDVMLATDIDENGLAEQANALRATGATVHTMVVDVADAGSVAAMVRRLEAEVGGLDVVVNNAAIPSDAPFYEMSEGDWDRVVDIGLKGPFLVSSLSWPLLRKPGGTIVNISSIHAQRLLPGLAAYGAAKGGLTAMTKAMALDAAAHGVRVNAVAPGFIETTPNRPPPGEARTARYRQISERVPAGGCGDPADVAWAVLWLAGPESAYVNGTVLEVDGGLAAQAYPPLDS